MQIAWRRNKVAELDSQGHNKPEISRIFQVSIGTVNGDLSILMQQTKQKIRIYIHFLYVNSPFNRECFPLKHIMNVVKAAIVDGEPTRWTWQLDPDEVKEIFNTLTEATKWRHCNNEKMTPRILRHLIDAGYKESYKH